VGGVEEGEGGGGEWEGLVSGTSHAGGLRERKAKQARQERGASESEGRGVGAR
jgi:hypothetical protein